MARQQFKKQLPPPPQKQLELDLKLEEVETQLSNLLHQDRANWAEMARLALLVQQQKLYSQRGFKSFTQWVKETARANDRQPSLVWLNIKAARYYLKLRHLDALDLEHITEALAAPEALATLEKIERVAPKDVFETLKDRVLAGDATVQECRRIERDYRPVADGQTNRGRPAKGQEGSLEQMGVWKSAETRKEEESSTILTRSQIALTIKRSLKSSSDWVQSAASMRYPPSNWANHSEVRVSTEDGRLRLDLVAVVRWSMKRPKDVFAVEIKSCLADFVADQKWTDYLDFCHYFSFAIPAADTELLKVIETNVPVAVGILGVDFSATPRSTDLSYKVQVIRQPRKQQATSSKISLVYETLYERVLGWSARDASSDSLSDSI